MMRLAFACDWEPDRRTTWSGSTLALWEALRSRVDLVDVPCEPRSLPGRLLRRIVREAARTTPIEPWESSRIQERYSERRLSRGTPPDVDAVLHLNDVGISAKPFWLYQDLSYAALGRLRAEGYDDVLNMEWLSTRGLARREALQARTYEHAAGVFTMGRWLRDRLVDDGLVSSAACHAVGAGLNVPVAVPEARPARTPRRVLFVGRDFRRKGGDTLVSAVGMLRARMPDVTLTVIGPPSWCGALPSYVDYRGPQPQEVVAAAMADHDVFALPSRFEAYGIALAEALAYGLPCVARDAFAMPEIVTAGHDGLLVATEDPDELARALEKCLTDPGLRVRAWEGRYAVARRHSWDAVAARMIEVVGAFLSARGEERPDPALET